VPLDQAALESLAGSLPLPVLPPTGGGADPNCPDTRTRSRSAALERDPLAFLQAGEWHAPRHGRRIEEDLLSIGSSDQATVALAHHTQDAAGLRGNVPSCLCHAA
jgi:hypothetical protein